jgi:hypothetical protein
MSNFSTINILKLNEVVKGKSEKTGKDWERHTAEAVCLLDDGSIECVGKLDIPPDMRGQVTVGVFRAGFSLHVPTYGDQQGKITSRLVSLQSVPVRNTAKPTVAA